MEKKQYPILEFDETKEAVIEPSIIFKSREEFKFCVITFFRDIIELWKKENKLKEVICLHSETIDFPIYEVIGFDKKIHVVLCCIGSAGAAGLLEELIGLGFKKFIVCGGAGVLQKDIAVGHLIIPVSAIRDEGVSYHYIKPSRKVECNPKVVATIENDFRKHHIEFIKAITWTTDAFYRETKNKIELRKAEGCVTVEMEAAALFSVAQFRHIELGYILYGGDDLSNEKWDSRRWCSRSEIRNNLLEISMRICLSL
ncbi:MAG TPA: nucleoside phosphorylase [Candidatus Cloacimonadota bacterium]|nr:nucleoside phosphorylase [Candidatus Cloacimonadota bacterium]